jgi:DNA-directed RNA polymerase subunit RPC12/RpoP
MRVEEAFAAAGINNAGEPVPDSLILATCAACGIETRLDRMATSDSGPQTNYECPECGTTVVTVGPAPGLTGYRLGDNVVNAPAGFKIVVPGPNQPPPP